MSTEKIASFSPAQNTAQIRAIAIAYLNGLTEKISTKDLVAALIARNDFLEGQEDTVTHQLSMLSKNGLINVIKEGRANYYVKASSKQIAAVDKPPKVTPTPKEAREKENLPAGIRIDIVKSTGRIRLSIQGLVIEIGVSET